MAKKEQILELLNAYKSEVDNFNDAIFTDKFEVLSTDIVKLFAIPVVSQQSELLIGFREWMRLKHYEESPSNDLIDEYLKTN